MNGFGIGLMLWWLSLLVGIFGIKITDRLDRIIRLLEEQREKGEAA